MPQAVVYEQTIYEALRECIEKGMSAEQAADSVLKRVSKNQLVDFVRPLLENEARRYTRAEVRKIEEKVDQDIKAGMDPIKARKVLANERIYIPGKGYVVYLDATADDHFERATYLRGQASSLVKDAERHEAAARDIIKHGVKCLRDIK